MPTADEINRRFSYPAPRSKVDALERKLAEAANNWYLTKDAKYVAEYHNIYVELCAQEDWSGAIDLDMELPDDLMPKHYLNKIHASAEGQ